MSCPPHSHCFTSCGDTCDVPPDHMRICCLHECEEEMTPAMQEMMNVTMWAQTPVAEWIEVTVSMPCPSAVCPHLERNDNCDGSM